MRNFGLTSRNDLPPTFAMDVGNCRESNRDSFIPDAELSAGILFAFVFLAPLIIVGGIVFAYLTFVS